MNKVTNWDDISFVISSNYRRKILEELKNPKTPSQLSNTLSINKTHISRALAELIDKKLINCLTPNHRKGRLYVISDYGIEVLEKSLTFTNNKEALRNN